ncbi:MAG: hypothetical protein H8D56_15840 [Planctomycetes bacterium]|nr:hypothetical protein [Planctomycetota bacterium]MBL7147033.1 hypothetical protein [Phycisphaerae bacterium]
MKKRLISTQGSTLIEILIAIGIMIFVILAIGMALVDGQRGWNYMYNRIYSDVVTDGYVARRKLDAILRKASGETFSLAGDGSWIEVNYYADDTSIVVDRYARFYVSGGDLNVEYGQLNPKQTISVETVCSNVSGCIFKQSGRSAQMILTLDDGVKTNTIITSAIANN